MNENHADNTNNTESDIHLEPDFILDAATRAFVAAGSNPEAAAIVADHLVEAELCGVTSHGIIRIPQYLDAIDSGKVNPAAEVTVRRDERATSVLDGNGGFGQVMAHAAMERALDKAEEYGVGAVTLVRCGHTGRLASYTLQAVKRSMAGIMLVNTGGHGQWVAPYGGIQGRLSTNPFSFALPRADGDPIVLDIASCAAPEGKVRAYQAAGRTLPAGWLADHTGRPSTDPADLYGPPRGTLQPLGGHKGFGLAMIVDLLAGALSGAGVCSDPDAPLGGDTDGILMIALRIESFCPFASFSSLGDQLVAHVKSAATAPGVDSIYFPGEIEANNRRRSVANGIRLASSTWELIRTALAGRGVL